MLDNRLRVSVIVPTYNRADLLREAIDSLLAQTRTPDEIIVVDDGSKDNTRAILDQYAEPVIAIYQPNNGRSPARNRGIDRATGDLIAFLDDDDTLSTSSIERRAVFLEANLDFGVVYGDIHVVDQAGRDLGRFSQITGMPAHSGDVFASFAQRNPRPIHAYMIRRKCLDQAGYFKPTLSYLEDYHLFLRLATNCRFHYIDEVMGNYRYHDNRTTVTKWRQMQESEIAVREEAFAFPQFAALTPAEKARAYSVHASQYFLLGDSAAARRWYLRAIRTAPTMPRPYLLLGITFGGERGFDYAVRLQKRLRGGATTVEG